MGVDEQKRRDEQTRLRSLGALSHMLPVLSLIYAAGAILFLVAPPFVPNTPHVIICGVGSTLVLLTWAGLRADDPRFDTPISLMTISIPRSRQSASASSPEPASTISYPHFSSVRVSNRRCALLSSTTSTGASARIASASWIFRTEVMHPHRGQALNQCKPRPEMLAP